MAPGLRGDDLLLEACQQQLPLGQGQTQIGDIGKIIGLVDLHDIGAPLSPASASVFTNLTIPDTKAAAIDG